MQLKIFFSIYTKKLKMFWDVFKIICKTKILSNKSYIDTNILKIYFIQIVKKHVKFNNLK